MAATNPSASFETRLRGFLHVAAKVLSVLLVLVGGLYALELHLYLGLALFRQQFLGLALALVLAIIFLRNPTKGAETNQLLFFMDLSLAFMGMVCGLYVAFLYPKVADLIQFPSPDKYILGTIACLLVLEASRRLYGYMLSLIAVIFILYARFADFFPEPFRTRGVPWNELSGELFLSSNAMLGIPMDILATMVLVFMLFGHLLFAVGGGEVFSDLASALTGRYRGGPAKVSVVSSALFGSISGSGVANVAITGTVTIPLMKRLGYQGAVAGAVEATASTGGMIMPPVMGAVAFIMAEFLQIPYREVVIAAFIPALLYFGAVLIQVDLEAAQKGLKGLPPESIPRIWAILRKDWPFLLPLPVLIVTLVCMNWQPARSGMAGTLIVVAVGLWYMRDKGVKWWFEELAKGGISIAGIIVIGALVGLIVGSSDMTGLGFSLSFPLLKIGEVNELLFLFVTALISLILGMGLPGIAIYIMQTALIVPSLVKMGISPIASHFFIMYYGTFSMITPPVCISSMAAAAIAKAPILKTGWESVKLGIVAFIIPIMFVFSPSLLFQGPLKWVLINSLSAGLGVIGMSVALRGFFFSSIGIFSRLVLFVFTIALLLPVGAFPFAWLVNAGGLIMTILILGVNYRNSRDPAPEIE